MRGMREPHGQKRVRRECIWEAGRHTHVWSDHQLPTAHALVQFKVTAIRPEELAMNKINPSTAETPEVKEAPTSAAELKISLVDVDWTIGKRSKRTRSIRTTLSEFCITAIGGIVRATLHRNRT